MSTYGKKWIINYHTLLPLKVSPMAHCLYPPATTLKRAYDQAARYLKNIGLFRHSWFQFYNNRKFDFQGITFISLNLYLHCKKIPVANILVRYAKCCTCLLLVVFLKKPSILWLYWKKIVLKEYIKTYFWLLLLKRLSTCSVDYCEYWERRINE